MGFPVVFTRHPSPYPSLTLHVKVYREHRAVPTAPGEPGSSVYLLRFGHHLHGSFRDRPPQ